MHSPNLRAPSRRSVLKGVAATIALLSTTSLTRPVFGRAEPFSFDALTERVRQAAAAPYGSPPAIVPASLSGLDYDGYRLIQFMPDHGAWADDSSGYQIHAYHAGWLYTEPVRLFEVADGMATPLDFGVDDFQYLDAAVRDAVAAEFPGVAGFRVNYPLNRPDAWDELVSFLGASYFRSLGRDNVYGASARGLVLNSWRDGPEEFPRFSEFYLEKPQPGAPLTINAVLDSPSVTGAYRFVITPAGEAEQATAMEVTARLFFRTDVAEVGIAPLTSMFLFAEANRGDFDDYRPQVHDSNGLLVERESGEVMWRALNNAASLGNSYLWENNPRAFGLYQRGRDFESYQDSGAHYERRPSLRVEPIGAWGQGSIRLIEIPARLEADDNIVAFWIPSDPVKAGESREFSYRLLWGDLNPDAATGHVVETRGGQGGVSGVENAASLRKFVVDFKGGELDAIPEGTPLDILAQAGGGTIVSSTLNHISENGVWRLALDVETEGTAPLELKAYLVGMGRKLTETWLYQWRASA